MKMEQKEFEGLAYIISSIVCLSDQSRTPLPQLTKASGRDNLDVIVEQAFLGSFMSYDDMAFEINRYCGLELPLDTPPREMEDLKWMGISLAGMVSSKADLFAVLTSDVAAEGVAELAELSKKELVKTDKVETEIVNQVPLLHVLIDYFPWCTQEGVLRFQMLEIFDIRADANTIEEGKEQLAAALMEYAREYASKGYDQDFRQRYHRLYITWVLRADSLEGLQKMIVYKNEQKVREEMTSPKEYMQRLSSNIEDELVGNLMRLWRQTGTPWDKLPEKERDALVEKAIFEIERRYQEGEGDESDG